MKPTDRPTDRPSLRPTLRPTEKPSTRPTDMPTNSPVMTVQEPPEGCPGPALTCDQIISSVPVWGFGSKGIDFTSVGYAIDIGTFTLVYIGCPTDGCDPNEFYCKVNDDGSLEFGTNAEGNGHGALRTLLSNATKPSEFPSKSPGKSIVGCATKTNPTRIHNAPVDHLSVKQICKQLGYRDGTVIDKINSNFCPEPEYINNTWTTDFIHSDGFGRQFKCTNPCPKCPLYKYSAKNTDNIKQELIHEIESELISKPNNNPSYSVFNTNPVIIGTIIIITFIIGILFGKIINSCKYNNHERSGYKMVDKTTSSTSEYTTDDVLTDDNKNIIQHL